MGTHSLRLAQVFATVGGMIITCPECGTRYNVSAKALGNGRSMRCAGCDNVWFQPPVDDKPAADTAKPQAVNTLQEAGSKPPLPPVNPLAGKNIFGKQEAKSGVLWPLVLTMVIALLLLAAGGAWWFLYGQHKSPVEGFSPIAFGSDMKSEPQDETGLVMSDIQRNIVEDGKVTVLVFTGKVTNTGTMPVTVPEIRVQLLDDKGVELDFWPAEVKQENLAPLETSIWTVRFLNAPLTKIKSYKAFFKQRVEEEE
ncbi:MAG: zinc-ribbon domain-containing protein [Alphaproteobacteria bacterium]